MNVMGIKSQSGITIVEMMIAMLLGIIIIIFVGGILVTTNGIITRTTTTIQANENGRFAINYLQQKIRMAGYSSRSELSAIAPWCPSETTLNCTNSTRERLAIQREYNSDDGENLDCAGYPISGMSDGDVIVDVYYTNSLDNGDGQNDLLMCNTYDLAGNTKNSEPYEITSGVVSFRVLYGVSEDGSGAVSKYEAPSATIDYRKVSAVRVGVLSRSYGTGGLDEEVRSYGLLDMASYIKKDRIARAVHILTIFLPNKRA